MTRSGHIFTVLALILAFLMGAAGGAMAHVDTHGGPMDHHGSHHAPSPSAPSPDDAHKVALVVVAPCCPATQVQADHVVAVPMKAAEASWHPRAIHVPNARDITPDTPPPKTSL